MPSFLVAALVITTIVVIGIVISKRREKAGERKQQVRNEAAARVRRQNRQTWDNPVPLRPVQTRPANHTMATPTQRTRREAPSSDSGDDGLVLSAVAGYVTDNGLVGALVGGNLTGGIIGDALNNDDDRRRPDCVSEPTSSNDGASTDSGSCPSDSSGSDSSSSSSFD